METRTPLPRPKMATSPGRTPGSPEPLPLPSRPCAGDDGKKAGGGAGVRGRGTALRPPARTPAPPHVAASRPGALARPGGARCLLGYSARPASPPGLRCGREIRVFFQDGGAGFGVTGSRRQSLNPLRRNLDTPPSSRSRTPLPLSHPPACALAFRRRLGLGLHLADPTLRAAGGGASLGASRGRARSSPQPSPGSAGPAAPQRGQAAAGGELGVSCGPGAPFPGLRLRRRKRGSRMSPGGGGSDRERGGGGRRRRAKATATSEAAAAARATARARGRPQVSVAGGRSRRRPCRRAAFRGLGGRVGGPRTARRWGAGGGCCQD